MRGCRCKAWSTLSVERREIEIRDGNGGKDRVTVLPENLILPLNEYVARRRALHNKDLAEGLGVVYPMRWQSSTPARRNLGAGNGYLPARS